MSGKLFFGWLIAITVPLVILSTFLTGIEGFEATKSITAISIPFFVVLSIIIYFLAVRAARSKDKNSLTRLVMATVFIKLVGCLAIIIIHDRIYHPESGHYVIPFIVYYILYTVFEVKLLTDLNKTTRHHVATETNQG